MPASAPPLNAPLSGVSRTPGLVPEARRECDAPGAGRLGAMTGAGKRSGGLKNGIARGRAGQ